MQSVLELTTASRPPSRQSEAAEATLSAPTVTGQMLKDGSGVLGDGTRWQKRSGEEFGPDGYWKRWTQLVGMSQDGTVGKSPLGAFGHAHVGLPVFRRAPLPRL